MAMKINGNLPDYPVKKWDHGSYEAQNAAKDNAVDGTKKGTENTSGTAQSGKSDSTLAYMKQLEKLAPSVKFRIGSGFQTAKSGKTLTIDPKLLEKMQNDPEQEKETKELIRGVESAMVLIENICKARGTTLVYKHSYIDENGQFRSIGYYRNDRMLNMSAKLRKKRKEISEKLLERSKEKAAEKKKRAEEMQEEKAAAKTEERPTSDPAEQLINEKMAASKDGTIYLADADIRRIIKAAREKHAGETTVKERTQGSTDLDLRI